MADATVIGYKRLGFVETYAVSSAEFVDKVYKTAREYVPVNVKPYVEKAEETIAAKAAPYLASGQDFGGKALHTVDSQVDYYVSSASKLMSAKVSDEQNKASYYAAMKSYFDAVMKTGDYASEKLSSTKPVQTAHEILISAVTKAKTMVDPKKAIETVHQAWLGFINVPPVAALLATPGRTTQATLAYLDAAKNTLVANPAYKKAVDNTSASLSYIMETAPVKTANSFIGPYAAPVIEHVSKSPHIKAAMDYFKPVESTPAAA